MTDNAADGGPDAERTVGPAEAIAFSPISVPDEADRARGRRRRRLVAGAVAVVVVAGGITAWVVAAGGGDGRATKHTAVLPQAFGAYTRARPADSLWSEEGGENTDPAKGQLRLTYVSTAAKAATVTIRLDPAGYTADDGTSYKPGSAAQTKILLAVDDLDGVRSYPAGKQGGTITCAEVTYKSVAITRCAWQSDAAEIVYAPFVNKAGTKDTSAQTDFREFLDALTLKPVKG